MGPRSPYLETVLTCMGDYYSPDFHRQLSVFHEQLQQLIFADDDRSLILKKVEPWNSVRVTFNIPADAAERLRQLAQHPNSVLRELGILAVQIGGDQVMSVGSTSSNTNTKPSDVTAGSCSQTGSQSASGVLLNSSAKNSGQSTDFSVQQFRVPTSVMPSCGPNILPPATGGVRTIAVERPVQDVVSNFTVAQPRPVGLVRWPSVMPSRPGTDAVAVRFAVPSLPVKDLSQGLCFISPLRAAISQNAASSSPLLVNLLQTRRQGITTIPSQPVVPLDTGASIPPQKRRRNASSRKAKQPRTDQEPVVQLTGLRPSVPSMSYMTQARILPGTTAFTTGSSTLPGSDSSLPLENDQITDESLTEGPGRPRKMINPYTGDLELVEEDNSLNVSICSSNDNSASSSSSALIETAATISAGQCVAVSGPSSQMLPISTTRGQIPAVVKPAESSTSGNLLAMCSSILSTENQTVSSSVVSGSMASTSLRYVDWYTASQSDKLNHLHAGPTPVPSTGDMPVVKQSGLVEGVKFSGVLIPSENLGIGGSSVKAETSNSGEIVKTFCTSSQSAVSSVPESSAVAVSCCSDNIPPHIGNFNTSFGTVPQLSSSQTDLIQMAFTLAKQNGSALHAVDNWAKNAGLLQNSLQSLHGLQSVSLPTTGIPLHSLTTSATANASYAQSRAKDADGLSTTATTVVSSDTCFFPAVSCFPPEQRRKSAVNIGAFRISPDPQLPTGSTPAASSLVSTLPAVKLFPSASIPLDVKTCGVSVIPNTTSNFVAVTAGTANESNLISASIERPPPPNTDLKKSIPLLTNLAPTSWPLMPNLLTVPLVNPTPLSGSPLLHCVTRAPLTPDGKLAGLSATVTNAKGSIVPLAGRFCIPLSSSQATTVTAGADKQNTESAVVSGIVPRAIMLTDNLTKFRLSVSSNVGKSSGKHGVSKDRRGSTARTDDSTVQRGSGKSHLTVAQLLDMAKNARLQQTVSEDEQVKSSESQNEPSSSVVTPASVQPALTVSPPKNLLQLSSLPLQSSAVFVASSDQSRAQFVSVQLSSSAGGSVHTAPVAVTRLQTATNPALSLASTSSIVVSQPAATLMASTLSANLLSQPLNTLTDGSIVATHVTTAATDVTGKVSVESALADEYLALNALSASASSSVPVASYSVQPPLPITSPRYPLNLTESVKKAMRGVGLYPSPPVSPTTPLQTFGNLKLPEIRPYPVSIACSAPVLEPLAKKPVHGQSAVLVPAMSTSSNSITVPCTNGYGLLPAFTTSLSTVPQSLTHAVSCKPSVADVNNGAVSASVVATGLSVAATNCVFSSNSQSVLSRSSAVQSEMMTTKCSSVASNIEQFSSMHADNSGLQEHAVSSHDNSIDGLHVTKTVNCLNGGLSASSADSDVELCCGILDGRSSIETDAGVSSLQSSPCSAELAEVPDTAKESNTAVGTNSKVVNCVTPVDRWHSTTLCEESMSLHCEMSANDDCIEAVLRDDVTDVKSSPHVTAVGTMHSTVNPACEKAAADSSMPAKCSLLRKNRLSAAASDIAIRSTTRRKRPAETDINCSDSDNSAKPVGEQHKVTFIGSITRMTTRSSRRTAISATELSQKSSSDQTKAAMQKMPANSLENRGHSVSESSNHSSDIDKEKSIEVAQRRPTRTPAAKVVDLKKCEMVTMSQEADSGISLRSRRQVQKMNSVEVVTPRKRAGLRGTGVSKEELCVADSTESVISVIDGKAGSEINVNDHEDDSERLNLSEGLSSASADKTLQSG